MTYTFKTNINCGGCIAKVTPFMEEATGITHWEVDTANPDKLLTVETPQLSEAEVMAVVSAAGFAIEPKKKGLLGKLFG